MSRLNTVNIALALLVLVTALSSFSSGEKARFDNYRLYRANADTASELTLLRNIEGSSDSLIFLDDVQAIGKDVHIVVAPHKVPDFLEAMSINEVTVELLEMNFQNILDTEETPTATTRQLCSSTTTESCDPQQLDYNWKAYQSLNDTYEWMQSLASRYPGLVTLIEGGKSFQNRSILGVKISASKNKLKRNPGIFLEAGIHAREWIGPATATYIINQLLNSTDQEVRFIAQNYDWYIFPNTNPDGYEYTRTTYRLWRKTRTPYANGCFGADPNRNWGFHWNEIGASSNPCADTYAGPRAFSEIEVESLSKYIKSLKGKIQVYISLHAYSQFLLYPFGGIPDLPKNNPDLQQISNATVAAIFKRFGTVYTSGNIYTAIYPAAGSSIDWAYDNAGTQIAFVFELRPSANNIFVGFKLPPKEIEPTGAETLDGIIAMIKEAGKLGYFGKRELGGM